MRCRRWHEVGQRVADAGNLPRRSRRQRTERRPPGRLPGGTAAIAASRFRRVAFAVPAARPRAPRGAGTTAATGINRRDLAQFAELRQLAHELRGIDRDRSDPDSAVAPPATAETCCSNFATWAAAGARCCCRLVRLGAEPLGWPSRGGHRPRRERTRLGVGPG
jgi:hypothetical protein